jgi:hypothetical protein
MRGACLQRAKFPNWVRRWCPAGRPFGHTQREPPWNQRPPIPVRSRQPPGHDRIFANRRRRQTLSWAALSRTTLQIIPIVRGERLQAVVPEGPARNGSALCSGAFRGRSACEFLAAMRDFFGLGPLAPGRHFRRKVPIVLLNVVGAGEQAGISGNGGRTQEFQQIRIDWLKGVVNFAGAGTCCGKREPVWPDRRAARLRWSRGASSQLKVMTRSSVEIRHMEVELRVAALDGCSLLSQGRFYRGNDLFLAGEHEAF